MSDVSASGTLQTWETIARKGQSWSESLASGTEHSWHDAFAKAKALQESSSNPSSPNPFSLQGGQGRLPPGHATAGSTKSLQMSAPSSTRASIDPVCNAGLDVSHRGLATESAQTPSSGGSASALALPCQVTSSPEKLPTAFDTMTTSPRGESDMGDAGSRQDVQAFSAHAHADAQGNVTLYLRAAGWSGADALVWAAEAARWMPSTRRFHLAEIVLNGRPIYRQHYDEQSKPPTTPLHGMMVIA